MPVRHILVVDDSKSARLMLRKMLQGFGMTVDMVESAEEALSYLLGRRPDAIFMDHTMPGMDGLMALQQIRSDPVTAAIPVAMYTSKDEPAYQEQAREAGAIGVLSKPATPESLGAILKQMHALFDAAQSPATPAVSSGEAITAQWVEKLVLEKAELVFYDMIESQVLPLINNVIAKLRRELESSHEEACARIATRVCEVRLTEWRPPLGSGDHVQPPEEAIRALLSPLLEERLETFRRGNRTDIEGMVRDVAGLVCQTQLHELSGRLVRQLSARFTEASQKAVVVAREAAIDAAREEVVSRAAHDAAAAKAREESGTVAAEQATRRLWKDIQQDLKRRIYLAAGAAAAVGIGAAVLAYGMR